MLLSRAHATIRTMHDAGIFGLRDLSQRLGIYPQTLRYILTGSVPKVTLAVGIERELGIPLLDWTIPASAAPPPASLAKGTS